MTARKYPWGDDRDQEKANSLEGRVLKPSPVGAYSAAGAVGPYGAEDQAGNVYDWTSSLYLPYPYDAEKSEQEKSTDEAASSAAGPGTSFVGMSAVRIVTGVYLMTSITV